jgi:hypothetical protein
VLSDCDVTPWCNCLLVLQSTLPFQATAFDTDVEISFEIVSVAVFGVAMGVRRCELADVGPPTVSLVP